MTKKSMQSSTLDFVITWVDGSDPAWLDEKSHFASGSEADNRKERYRDWDHLKYWFRGIGDIFLRGLIPHTRNCIS